MRTHILSILPCIVLLLLLEATNARGGDTLRIGKRNVIKYNLSSALLWGFDNFSLQYERTTKPNQSFSIMLGHRTFPKLVGSDSALLVREHKDDFGLYVLVDYRFYLKSKNRNPAPDGVYLSPFAYYYQVGFSNVFTAFAGEPLAEPVRIHSGLRIGGVGLSLGYQFVILKRFSVDLSLLGPSLSLYDASMDMTGNIDIDTESEYYQAMRDLVLSKYPFLEGFLENKEINERGTLRTMSFGFNYSIRVGYLF